MPAFFGDGFDLYAAPADAYMGGTYWDSGSGANITLLPGRYSGSRGMQFATANNSLQKSLGSNDDKHHFNVSIQQTSALSGTIGGFLVRFLDGATVQCSIIFRSDGAITLTSGNFTNAAIATYTGALTAINTWYGFEVEVVIHNTAGSIAIRKSGNTSNDFFLGSLNTRGGTANNYANVVTLGGINSSAVQTIDDFLWRSDTSAVPWAGELRCYTRMPASDAAVQWTPSGSVVPVPNFPGASTGGAALSVGTTRYMPFTPVCDGTVGTLTLQCVTAATANIKCSLFASLAGVPTTVIGSATVVTNPGVGTTTFTFTTPAAVSRGTLYFVAFAVDATSGTFGVQAFPALGYTFLTNIQSYATFPAANPTGLSNPTTNAFVVNVNITPTGSANAPFVADTAQDAAATYVSSGTVGQTDFYGVAPISGTPTSVVGVVTRALAQKTDAGTRNIALKLKSGATDVTGTSTALNTSFGWVWRSDQVDPATGAAWTPTGVNNLQIGQTVTA